MTDIARLTAHEILAPTFLFRFAVPIKHVETPWTATGKNAGANLDESFRLPSFGELEGRRLFADFRGAWHESGLAFHVRVAGKRQHPWCRESRLDESDGLHLWVDTRDTHNIHRAGRFCHRFAFLPMGSGRKLTDPIAAPVLIARAREHPKPAREGAIAAISHVVADGYELSAFIPAEAMTGWDTTNHTRLGFTYAVTDRELGWQTFTIGREFPFTEDPSLWGTVELV